MCGPDCELQCNVYQVGSKGSAGAFNVSINADIVLNGVIDNAGDPRHRNSENLRGLRQE